MTENKGDLISREALKKHKFTTQVANGVEIEDIEVIPISTIDNAPAVHTKNDCIMKKCTICPHCDNCDVDENGKVHNERPKGEWIETSETWEEPGGYGMGYDWGYYYSCSICNNKVRNKTCFCDRCGADMRGENE